MNTFNEENFHALCDHLALHDDDLNSIILRHGYPPFWSRKPGFATLIHIILEQQVSLASAKAALEKLQTRLSIITPSRLTALSIEEMKACYFSRQKIIYARHLAEAIISKQLNLKKLEVRDDLAIREQLKKIKGIGDWTVDVYLMMALHRTDFFPLGDVALVNSLKNVKGLPKNTTKAELENISDVWKPHRTIAAFLLWHDYLQRKSGSRKVRKSAREQASIV